MNRNEVENCLLCNAPLNSQMDWKRLFFNRFPKVICEECENQFEWCLHEQDEEVVSLYYYNEAMQDYLHRYKFMHDVLLAKVFREEIYYNLKNRKEMIVPIPMHPEKLKERTFSHVDELLKQARIPYVHLLEKITTETQGGKTRKERMNTPQIFKLKKTVQVEGKEILLVDDIYTTGTTIRHAKRVLIEGGAKSVKAFTLIKSGFYK
ncbi:ComF family protein [Ureibacillus thermosphaericus]|uniref:ComF family protein n=1 Tax=Ureibacillus thermosphaericus TaxID=51173 RepID=UPI0030C99502